MKFNNFEELDVWKKSVDISVLIYKLTLEKSFSKDFGLKDQIRRASISISSNIAEGFERNNNKEFIRFLKIAKASLGEVKSQLYLSFKIGYLSESTYYSINMQISELSSQIGGFIKYLKTLNK